MRRIRVFVGNGGGQLYPQEETVKTVENELALLADCVLSRYHGGYIFEFRALHVYDGSSAYDWIYGDNENIHVGRAGMGYNIAFFSEAAVYSECSDIWFFDDATAERHDHYYYVSANDYMDYDPEDNEDNEDNTMYRFSYHSGNRHSYLSDQAFGIGFEVEKEDYSVLTEESADDVWERTKWAKESDGSLDDKSGYELVSPVFPLFEHDFVKEFKKVESLIGAEYSRSCGGHINLSIRGKTSAQVLETLSGWLPLFYAMYSGRITAHYCQAKKKKNYGDGEKYSAIYLKQPNILEFRILSAVRDKENLLWRTELFKIMCLNLDLTELQVLRLLIDPEAALYAHIRKIYDGERFMNIIRKFVKFSDDFNDARMPSLTEERIKKFELNFIKNKKGGKK